MGNFCKYVSCKYFWNDCSQKSFKKNEWAQEFIIWVQTVKSILKIIKTTTTSKTIKNRQEMKRFSFISQFILIIIVILVMQICRWQTLADGGDNWSLSTNNKMKRTPPPILIGLKKRNENLCPNEYRSCWCDYINTNNSVYSKLSSSFSIIIDCQFYSSPSVDSTSSSSSSSSSSRVNLSDYRSNIKTKAFMNKSVLTEIPKIITNLPNKFKYLLHITHLDLSRTNIVEVQTDAFHVNFKFSSFLFFFLCFLFIFSKKLIFLFSSLI
jgi:hypothetical protein